ncbi:MAG: SirB2 family protein [Mariprofundus sp.]
MTWLLPLHVGLVSLSLLLFIGRGIRMWMDKPVSSHLWRRVLPDTVDTLLLGSGILLAYSMHVTPWQDDWLAAKLVAIVLYVLLGMVAFRHSGALWIKRSCLMIALLTVVYIVAVAHSMQAWPWA